MNFKSHEFKKYFYNSLLSNTQIAFIPTLFCSIDSLEHAVAKFCQMDTVFSTTDKSFMQLLQLKNCFDERNKTKKTRRYSALIKKDRIGQITIKTGCLEFN